MITERFDGFITDIGQFDIPLNPDIAPWDAAIEKIEEFGHIVITGQWFQHPQEFLDADLLRVARYVGVVIEPERSLAEHHIRGNGVAWYLGDRETGPRYPNPITFTTDPPTTVLAPIGSGGLLPLSIEAGNIVNTSAMNYNATDAHQFETAAEAIGIYLRTTDAHARINGNGTIDVCRRFRDDVYVVSEPRVVASRFGWGQDPGSYTGVHCQRMLTRKDATRYVTDGWLIDRETGTLVNEVDTQVPYSDLHGNDLDRTFLVESLPEDSFTEEYLENEIRNRGTILESEIDTDMFELAAGNMNVGDWIWCYSPEDGFVDLDNEIHFRGQIMWPMKARVMEGTWPSAVGMGVYYRPIDTDPEDIADWIDLSPSVDWEFRGGRSYSRLVVRAGDVDFFVPI